MIYLDTHVVVWFYANDKRRFSESLQALMNAHEWTISPIVRLELQYLHEIGRVNPTVDTIINELSQRVGLSVCPKPFDAVIYDALKIAWTRDPFDRMIVAHAGLNHDVLVTADQSIHNHYPRATW